MPGYDERMRMAYAVRPYEKDQSVAFYRRRVTRKIRLRVDMSFGRLQYRRKTDRYTYRSIQESRRRRLRGRARYIQTKQDGRRKSETALSERRGDGKRNDVRYETQG